MPFCLLSASAFGAAAIFAKYAYASGVNVLSLLGVRFVIAAVVLWLLAKARGAVGSGRSLVAGAILGFTLYASQAGLYFGALERLDASMASLIVYVYPALTLVGAAMLGRDHVSPRRAAALALSLAGVALVVVGGEIGSLDAIGVLMALGAAAGYAGYILGSDVLSDGASPLAFAAAVCTGAANGFLVVGAALGELDLGFAAEGWLWIAALATVSTVIAVTAFLEGLQRIGPARASIVSTVEPPVTLMLAALTFGERLGPVQLAGGALVLGAVVLIQTGSGREGYRLRAAEAPV